MSTREFLEERPAVVSTCSPDLTPLLQTPVYDDFPCLQLLHLSDVWQDDT
jgi:hypothetical protein